MNVNLRSKRDLTSDQGERILSVKREANTPELSPCRLDFFAKLLRVIAIAVSKRVLTPPFWPWAPTKGISITEY